VDDIALVIDRWRANARAAGIDLPDSVVNGAERAGTLGQIVALEELLRRLDPGFVMPDALARPWDAEQDDA
jgi:hypothetical protein